MSARRAPRTSVDGPAGGVAWSDRALDEAVSTALYETIGTLVVVLDRDGRIVRFNPACERLTGYTAHEVTGRPGSPPCRRRRGQRPGHGRARLYP